MLVAALAALMEICKGPDNIGTLHHKKIEVPLVALLALDNDKYRGITIRSSGL